jgi:hypothetical protein
VAILIALVLAVAGGWWLVQLLRLGAQPVAPVPLPRPGVSAGVWLL